MEERYTHMQHNIRKHFKLTMEQYAVLDAIYVLSRNMACHADKTYFIELFDISERTYYNIIKTLKDKKLIEKVKGGIRTTHIWDDAMAGRVAPWVDPSAAPKTEQDKAPADDKKDDNQDENSETAEFAVCDDCRIKLQDLQIQPSDTAKIAVNLCKNCSEVLQNLQKTTAKIAVINIEIDSEIYIEIDKKLAPAGATPHGVIDELFRKGSKKLSSDGEPYYKDAKEANHIKLLENRYMQNPSAFINLTRKFYWMIKNLEDDFWSSQPFTPSAFNSLYNRILCFQAPVKMQKQEAQKSRTAEDVIWDNYGGYDIDKLKYLQRGGTISQADFDYIVNRQMEESA